MKQLVKRTSVSIVDDDEAVRDSLDAYLTLKGMIVRTYGSASEVLISQMLPPDILILDINMSEIDGFLLLEKLRARGYKAPVIFITGLGDKELRLRAMQVGAAAFLDKPIDAQLLLTTLNRLTA